MISIPSAHHFSAGDPSVVKYFCLPEWIYDHGGEIWTITLIFQFFFPWISLSCIGELINILNIQSIYFYSPSAWATMALLNLIHDEMSATNNPRLAVIQFLHFIFLINSKETWNNASSFFSTIDKWT